MTDCNTTYDTHGISTRVLSLPALDPVSSDLLGLIVIISILILLLSEGNILLGIIS